MSTNIEANLLAELEDAEKQAINALGRYKFWMFGYWAGIWVHLNRVGNFKRPNPFRDFVVVARSKDGEKSSEIVDLATVTLERDTLRDDLNTLEKACSYCVQAEDYGDPERHHHEPEGWHWHHYLDPGDGPPSPCANSDLFERLLQNGGFEPGVKEPSVTVDVRSCQRCGEDHSIDFRLLTNPADEWTYYGVCSNTLEPVLLRIQETNEQGK